MNHTKVEVVLDWDDVYVACRRQFPERFQGFDDGSWTGVSWPGAVIFRQDRLDGLEPNINPTAIDVT